MMDGIQLAETISDAKRIMQGHGRSGRGRFVEATARLAAELDFLVVGETTTKVLTDRWFANPAKEVHPRHVPVIGPQYLADHPVRGKTLLELLDHGRPGREIIRWMGLRCRYGKAPLRIWLAACGTAVVRDGINWEQV